MVPDAFSPLYLQFQQVAGTWFSTLFTYAQRLFLMLATLEIGLAAIHWMAAQQSHDSLAMALFRKVLWIGFMYAVLLNAHDWIPAVISSFAVAGQRASGVQAINPGEVFQQGLALSGSMLSNLVSANLLFRPASTFAGLGAAFILFFSFCAIAMQLALTLMEIFIITGGGVLLLGFGSFAGTVHITEKYLSYVVGVGVKLFVLYLIIGASTPLVQMWQAMINAAGFLDVVSAPLAVAGAAMLYGAAAWMIPSLAASMASGAVGFGAHEAIHTTMMASRLAASTVAAPVAGVAGAVGAAGIGVAAAKNAGGGIVGGLKGLGSAGASLSREAVSASVPRLGRMAINLNEQRKKT